MHIRQNFVDLIQNTVMRCDSLRQYELTDGVCPLITNVHHGKGRTPSKKMYIWDSLNQNH